MSIQEYRLTESSQRYGGELNKIKTLLKPHQQASLHRANLFESSDEISLNDADSTTFNTKCGVICDNVGSGKSLTVLSLIALNKVVEDNKRISYSNSDNFNIFKKSTKHNPSFLKTNILVVPHNIIQQWIGYIKKDTNLSHIVISTSKEFKKYLLVNNDSISGGYYSPTFDKEAHIEKLKLLEEQDIILVSSTRYNQLSDHINTLTINGHNIYVSRLIFDEADSIKISGCRQIHSNFTWIVSSNIKIILNPQGIVMYENDSGQQQSWYSWGQGFTKRVVEDGITCRGYIKSLCQNLSLAPSEIKCRLFIHNDLNFIKNSFSLQRPKVHSVLCKDPPIMNVLNNIVSTDMMNFINAGDIEGAINSMNCKKVDENSLISLVTQDLEKDLHNKRIELEAKKSQIYSSEKAKEEAVKKTEEKVQELETKIINLKNKLEESATCPVCYDSIENTALCGACNTKFCVECITTWIASNSSDPKCPFCRHKISHESLIVISNNVTKTEEKKDKLKDKIKNLKKIIKFRMEKESKMLIFSNYDGSFVKIKKLLDDNDIKYCRIMGSSSHINNVVNNFKKDFNDPEAVNVLLLNSKYFGSGLNLQNATDVIVYHNMSNEITNQVIGRAQRPGRKEQLQIWRLCYSNEIDEPFIYN